MAVWMAMWCTMFQAMRQTRSCHVSVQSCQKLIARKLSHILAVTSYHGFQPPFPPNSNYFTQQTSTDHIACHSTTEHHMIKDHVINLTYIYWRSFSKSESLIFFPPPLNASGHQELVTKNKTILLLKVKFKVQVQSSKEMLDIFQKFIFLLV